MYWLLTNSVTLNNANVIIKDNVRSDYSSLIQRDKFDFKIQKNKIIFLKETYGNTAKKKMAEFQKEIKNIFQALWNKEINKENVSRKRLTNVLEHAIDNWFWNARITNRNQSIYRLLKD